MHDHRLLVALSGAILILEFVGFFVARMMSFVFFPQEEDALVVLAILIGLATLSAIVIVERSIDSSAGFSSSFWIAVTVLLLVGGGCVVLDIALWWNIGVYKT